jgi:hypothetical protein
MCQNQISQNNNFPIYDLANIQLFPPKLYNQVSPYFSLLLKNRLFMSITDISFVLMISDSNTSISDVVHVIIQHIDAICS